MDDRRSDRRTFIDKLLHECVFSRVDVPASLPNVWATPKFYAPDFKSNIVALRDCRTGKNVGEYSAMYAGLKMDQARVRLP